MAEASSPAGASAGPIHSDPNVLSGKPCIAGTRLSVEFLQGLKAIGWTDEKILGVYTYITSVELAAALAYDRQGA